MSYSRNLGHQVPSADYEASQTNRRSLRFDLRRPILAADDWGMSPGVNKGILELCRQGWIQKVSLMADGPYLRDGLEDLLTLPHVHLGIHLNLTFQKPWKSAHQLAKKWMTGSAATQKALVSWVRDETQRQISLLQDQSVPLVHFDGHQHVHVLPGLLSAIQDDLRGAGIEMIRVPLDWSLWKSSRFVLLPLAWHFSKKVKDLGFKTLKFSYPSTDVFQCTKKLSRYLELKRGNEVLIHPASEADFDLIGIADDLKEPRVLQYQQLKKLAL